MPIYERKTYTVTVSPPPVPPPPPPPTIPDYMILGGIALGTMALSAIATYTHEKGLWRFPWE